MLDVLLVDDDACVRESVRDALEGAGHRVAQAEDGEKALSLLGARSFDVAICDVQMPKMDGLTLCRRLRRESPGTALVLMTSFGNVTDAVTSLRGGVVDYVSKPFDPDEFVANVLGPIAERQALRRRFDEARAALLRRDAGAELVGASLAMRQLDEAIVRASRSDAAVLVRGERGTGKKLVARTLHAESPRRGGPFVVVPCAALDDLMLSSELFELSELRARQHRDEWFRAASGGTLVLDGIEQLSADASRRLLRVLDETTLHARRSADWQPLGVRVVSIETHPRGAPPRSTLTEALRLRLGAVRLDAPALRDRDGDLYVLVSHFLRELTPPARSAPSLTPRAWKALTDYPFPGNVRELVWALEHAIAQAGADELDLPHLPEELTLASAPDSTRGPSASSPW